MHITRNSFWGLFSAFKLLHLLSFTLTRSPIELRMCACACVRTVQLCVCVWCRCHNFWQIYCLPFDGKMVQFWNVCAYFNSWISYTTICLWKLGLTNVIHQCAAKNTHTHMHKPLLRSRVKSFFFPFSLFPPFVSHTMRLQNTDTHSMKQWSWKKRLPNIQFNFYNANCFIAAYAYTFTIRRRYT